MSEITSNTEPRPSLLAAIWFLGLAITLASGKHWFDDCGMGTLLMFTASGWAFARAWYLRKESK